MACEPELTGQATSSGRPAMLACVLYVAFVVYGSLVPLQYEAMPLGQAWARFRATPFLQLGAASRADWIANGVLYVPVGYLIARWLIEGAALRARGFALLLAAAASILLAVGVEFAQVYFPQRSVTLNDILAECIGSLLGILLFARCSAWMSRLFTVFSGRPTRILSRGLEAYVVIYLGLSLFPFDILVSRAELLVKMGSNSWGWLIANPARGMGNALMQSLLEAAFAVPVGIWWMLGPGRRKPGPLRASMAGLGLGLFIELAQFCMVSGVSQGLSVIARVGGVLAGAVLVRTAGTGFLVLGRQWVRRFTLPMAFAWILALCALNGLMTLNWSGPGEATEKFARVSFLPFYYHYFTSEAKALLSLTVVGVSYLPVALFTWARSASGRRAIVVAVLLAAILEGAKLFVEAARPDPTNMLIAAVVTWLGGLLLEQLTGSERRASLQETHQPVTSAKEHETRAERRPVAALSLAFVGMASALAGASLPGFGWLGASGLAAFGVLGWKRPLWIFGLLAASLPILDLAPWTGRLFWDEFDWLVTIGLFLAYVRRPSPVQNWRPDAALRMLGTLAALMVLVGLIRGLMPLQAVDANAFNSYLSPYNALRVAKGALWGFLFCALFRRYASGGMDPTRVFAWGTAGGLALTVLFVLWERVAFTGLWNFSNDYRVTGPFSAMHVGGAFIECFIVVATPYVVYLAIARRNFALAASSGVLLLVTTYALMVTYSRNGYFAFALTLAISGLAAMAAARRRRWGTIFVTVILGSGMAAIAYPVFFGAFAQSRIGTVDADLRLRIEHWNDALSVREPGFLTQALGMGLGRFPVTSFWRSTILSKPGTFLIEHEADGSLVRLAPGNSVYLEQIVPVRNGARYRLQLDARVNQHTATLIVPLCEKWVLTSFNCIWTKLDINQGTNAWQHFDVVLDADKLRVGPWYSQRPVKLALFHPGPKSLIDVDNISLRTVEGNELLQNGDFSAGLDHWFAAADSHLQWHAKSLFVGVLFDQGWVGMAILMAVLALALRRAISKTWSGDLEAGAALASLSGFVTLGAFDTLIDAPRFFMLFVILCSLCIGSRPAGRAEGR